MLDTVGDDGELARIEPNLTVSQADQEPALDHEKQFVFRRVIVPDEFDVHLLDHFFTSGSDNVPDRTGTTEPPTSISSGDSWPPGYLSLMCTMLWRPIFVPCSLTISTLAARGTSP